MADIVQFKSNRDLIREKITEYWTTNFDREPTEQEIRVNMERMEFFQKR